MNARQAQKHAHTLHGVNLRQHCRVESSACFEVGAGHAAGGSHSLAKQLCIGIVEQKPSRWAQKYRRHRDRTDRTSRNFHGRLWLCRLPLVSPAWHSTRPPRTPVLPALFCCDELRLRRLRCINQFCRSTRPCSEYCAELHHKCGQEKPSHFPCLVYHQQLHGGIRSLYLKTLVAIDTNLAKHGKEKHRCCHVC